MADSRHFEKKTKIFRYLGNIWYGHAHCPLNGTGSWNLEILEMQDGGRMPFGKPLNHHISARYDR